MEKRLGTCGSDRGLLLGIVELLGWLGSAWKSNVKGKIVLEKGW
jgi:hypothetical protein